MAEEVKIDAEKFHARLKRFHSQWIRTADQPMWNGAHSLLLASGKNEDDASSYKKSGALHLHLFGWEFPETALLLTRAGTLYIFTRDRSHLRQLATADKSTNGEIRIVFLERNKEEGDAAGHARLVAAAKEGSSASGDAKVRVGAFVKENPQGSLVTPLLRAMEAGGCEFVEAVQGVGYILAVKDTDELESMRRAAQLTNKVMKKGFVERMEAVVDAEEVVSHEGLAEEMQGCIEDPTKLGVKIASGIVESCFFPIVQSGGDYDLRPSALSTPKPFKYDIIICSMGARFRGYCATMTRTFFIDPPKKVQMVYNAAEAVYQKCLDNMRDGVVLADVFSTATDYLQDRHPDLLNHLTRSLGFSLGLDFKESALSLNAKNAAKLREGMVFNLSVGFQNVPLDKAERKGSSYSGETFSLSIADTIVIKADEVPEVWTKAGHAWGDVSYYIKSADEPEGGEGDGGGGSGSRQHRDEEANGDYNGNVGVGARSSRLRDRGQTAELQEQANAREQRMAELLKKKAAEKAAKMRGAATGEGDEEEAAEIRELKAYTKSEEYPQDTMPNRLNVDMKNEVVLVPVNGQPVPFSIHTIKNVVMPEPDNHAHYLRINFFAPGQSLGKEASRTMARLVEKHGPRHAFIKELTYRSLEQPNLALAFRQIQELRKRLRTREQKAVEEADLVDQDKLVKLKDGKVPRLSDLTLRPNIQGKTVGSLEAHLNGLRFVSSKKDVLDILYANIKHAFFQPCDGKDTKVILHFHLKNPIMVGRKANKDIQVFTEAMDSTVNLDGARRSNYDPDELMEEQRDRQMRKKLNHAFKEFATKVTKVTQRGGYNLEFDIPYKELGFEGTPFREMVFVQPTTHALINVTDSPFFVVPLDSIEHVHFERVLSSAKGCDMKIIMEQNMKENGGIPMEVNMIDQRYLNQIMGWLEDSAITYTQSVKPWNWKLMLEDVRKDDRFYLDTDEDGERKPAGWARLRMEGSDDEGDDEENNSDEDFHSAEGEQSDDDDDDDDDESFDEDDDDDSGGEGGGESELSEVGETWEELEQKAARDDRDKRHHDDDDDRSSKRRRR